MSPSDASSQNIILTACDLGKQFGSRVALKQVSFSVRAGERVAVLGVNGAGKTTLLSLLTDTCQLDQGRLTCQCRVGWVPQQPEVYRKLSVRENLLLFARLEQVKDHHESTKHALEAVDLTERADDLVENLSGGMRQRVNVAIGLLHFPDLLVLDEPSAALDPLQRERLWELLDRRAQAGNAVIFSTHVLSEALHHADRLLVLAAGQTVFYGVHDELPGYATYGGEQALLQQVRVS